MVGLCLQVAERCSIGGRAVASDLLPALQTTQAVFPLPVPLCARSTGCPARAAALSGKGSLVGRDVCEISVPFPAWSPACLVLSWVKESSEAAFFPLGGHCEATIRRQVLYLAVGFGPVTSLLSLASASKPTQE